METARSPSRPKMSFGDVEQGANAGRSRTLTRTHRELRLGCLASSFSSRSPSARSSEGSRSRYSSVRSESPIQTDKDTGPKALRHRQLQEKRSSHGLFRDMPSYSPCGNLESTGGEWLSPKSGKTPGLHRSRPAGGCPDRSLYLRDMTGGDPLQVIAPSDEAAGPVSMRQGQHASHRKVVEASSLPSLWYFPGDTAAKRGTEASKATAENTNDVLRETEILMAESRKLENWLELGKPKSAEDLAKILTVPGGTARVCAAAAGRPSKPPHEGLGLKPEYEPLIHTSASCANLALERRRDTHCPVRAASGTMLALRRDEAKSALHPVLANTRRLGTSLGTSKVPSICKTPRRAA